MLTIDGDGSENKSIRLGNDDEMSMKALQNFYAKVTGKKEQISKSIQINHKTKFEDFENLHAKIQQVCGPLNIIQHNESVVVYHVNESKDQFSSFDSFRRYNKSSLNPVENVHLEYNILLTQPGLQDVQNYKIIIDIHSRAALLRKAEVDNGSMPNFIYHMVAKNTGNVKINYVDYVVAINFLIAIDQWFQSLPSEKDNRLVKFFKKTSHNFDFIFKYTSVSVFLTVCFLYFRNIPNNENVLLGLAIAVFGFAYVLGGVSSKIGDWVESSVDSIYSLSYVSLNRGDENVVLEQVEQNKRGVIAAILYTVSGIGINILSSFLAVMVGLN